MPRRAVKDTFAIERIGDIEVRRQVVAGSTVPDHYEVEDSSALESVDPSRVGPGYQKGAATQRVKVGQDGRVEVNHDPAQVGRVHSTDADRPMAEGERELAAAANPLRARRRPEGATAAEVAEKADAETQADRDRESEASNIERLEERLAGGDKPKPRQRRSRVAKPADAEADAPTGDAPEAEGDAPAEEPKTEGDTPDK